VEVVAVGQSGAERYKVQSIAEGDHLAHQLVAASIGRGENPPAHASVWKDGERVLEVTARPMHNWN